MFQTERTYVQDRRVNVRDRYRFMFQIEEANVLDRFRLQHVCPRQKEGANELDECELNPR